MKRFFDVILSISMVFLLSPILIIASIMIKMDSSGCVLFKQKRVGKLGKPFFIYKFRSMVENADKQGLYQTKENDIRITPVGRFIRRTSIDELPQLFNVIQGSMSLVGPRPNVFLQQKLYSQGEWEKRNSVRPGITGLAQALIRSSGTLDERTELDLKYIDKQSIFYDIYILKLTINQVLFKGDSN
jgi:lipopolysaccharide/colanic/teichoic acid biosynthesis glycosyltransferase